LVKGIANNRNNDLLQNFILKAEEVYDIKSPKSFVEVFNMWMLVFDKEIMQMRIKEVKEALVYACGAKKVENKDIFQII